MRGDKKKLDPLSLPVKETAELNRMGPTSGLDPTGSNVMAFIAGYR